jgi:hypothetical protein
MFNRNTLLALAVSLIAVPAFAAPAAANKYERAQLDLEIKSCIAELGIHANYADASQVPRSTRIRVITRFVLMRRSALFTATTNR